jgi:hypothetical protein
MWLNRGNAIDLDIERPGPFRHAHEDARRGIFREVARVDRVDSREVFCRRAVDVALRSNRFDADGFSFHRGTSARDYLTTQASACRDDDASTAMEV